ncbi:hypothetical protein [Peribacillus sp. Hz7]|uniref:hypothetical protein n=1 Tax=Peribacillus sp. Hz7 TaxID=3344873 RepID=UPI0035CA4382
MYEKGFRDFLYLNEILPYKNNKNWKSLKVEHKIKTPEEQKSDKKNLTLQFENVGFKTGLYLYENNKGEVLYIGKGMNKNEGILERIKSYYQKACNGDFKPKNQRHMDLIKLFRTNFGEINIYVFHMDDDNEAILIEEILTRELKPLYIQKYRQNT